MLRLNRFLYKLPKFRKLTDDTKSVQNFVGDTQILIKSESKFHNPNGNSLPVIPADVLRVWWKH